MAFLKYWQKLPDELDGLTSHQIRQLTDLTEKMIERDQREAAEHARQT